MFVPGGSLYSRGNVSPFLQHQNVSEHEIRVDYYPMGVYLGNFGVKSRPSAFSTGLSSVPLSAGASSILFQTSSDARLIADLHSEFMGLTSAKVTIKGEGASEVIELLVDTGSIYTWVAESTLSNLRVRSLGKRNFRTIEGRQIVREVGEAILEFAGENATGIVVFAKQGDAEVMGVEKLEGLGLEVDPTTKRLRRVEAFVAY